MVCASLVMYDFLPPVRAANDQLWRGVRDRLRAAGVAAPDSLDRTLSYDGIWLKPDLVLAQTCGYPYVSHLKGKVRLVATPVYDHPGGEGTERVSYVVVRADDPARSLADLRGRVVAINDHGSNSGMNLFRAALAPIAGGKPFFSSVQITGGHVASMQVVQDCLADTAAIDTVTFGLASRFQPDMVAGLRILAETPAGPGLPYITRIDASDAELQALRSAIADSIADPSLSEAIASLGLRGIELLDDADYDRLDAHRRDAERLGYPTIA